MKNNEHWINSDN